MARPMILGCVPIAASPLFEPRLNPPPTSLHHAAPKRASSSHNSPSIPAAAPYPRSGYTTTSTAPSRADYQTPAPRGAHPSGEVIERGSETIPALVRLRGVEQMTGGGCRRGRGGPEVHRLADARRRRRRAQRALREKPGRARLCCCRCRAGNATSGRRGIWAR
jgi:hypothetical protein